MEKQVVSPHSACCEIGHLFLSVYDATERTVPFSAFFSILCFSNADNNNRRERDGETEREHYHHCMTPRHNIGTTAQTRKYKAPHIHTHAQTNREPCYLRTMYDLTTPAPAESRDVAHLIRYKISTSLFLLDAVQ